jgi:anamorsin
MTTLSIALGNVSGETGSYDISAACLKDARSKTSLASNSLSMLRITVAANEFHIAWNNLLELSSFTELLQLDANVVVTIQSTEKDSDIAISLKQLHTSFLLAGLVGTLEKKESNGSRTITACKIPKNTLKKAAPLRVNQNNISGENSFNKQINLISADDDDIIDEDTLLSDASNIIGIPPAMNDVGTKDDCSGREPCENCTCGRADSNDTTSKITSINENITDENKEVPSSACGKCGLGDAFRCASCPYLGKPAFKPGEERLVLDLQDDL